jgi:hypothetical protein
MVQVAQTNLKPQIQAGRPSEVEQGIHLVLLEVRKVKVWQILPCQAVICTLPKALQRLTHTVPRKRGRARPLLLLLPLLWRLLVLLLLLLLLLDDACHWLSTAHGVVLLAEHAAAAGVVLVVVHV